MRRYYDTKAMATHYKVGTGVWLHNPQRKKWRSPKLSRNWDGPYVVVKQINYVVVQIKRSSQAKPKVVHVNRLKPYASEESFAWFLNHKDVDEKTGSNASIKEKTESKTQRVQRNENKDRMANPLRRSERIRNQLQKCTPLS